MRATLSVSAFVLLLSLAPASAMCGGMGSGQQAQASGQGGMMCGRPGQSTQAQTQEHQGMGMCSCCRGMAMMQGDGRKMDGEPHQGMDMQAKQ